MKKAKLKINKKLVEVIEKAGIRICESSYCEFYQDKNNVYTELEFTSDLGEDVIVTIWHNNTDDSFIKALEDYAFDFDPEEHATMWWNCKDTVSGVPHSLRALLNDADGIAETLDNLVMALHKERRTV